jgi:hypothetical protein
MKMLALFAATALPVLFAANYCSAQGVPLMSATASVLPVAMILPNVAPPSSPEYLSRNAYAEPMAVAGGFNKPYAVRRRHEEAYCSTQGLSPHSLAFGQCVAQVDSALFDRQFPIR